LDGIFETFDKIIHKIMREKSYKPLLEVVPKKYYYKVVKTNCHATITLEI